MIYSTVYCGSFTANVRTPDLCHLLVLAHVGGSFTRKYEDPMVLIFPPSVTQLRELYSLHDLAHAYLFPGLDLYHTAYADTGQPTPRRNYMIYL